MTRSIIRQLSRREDLRQSSLKFVKSSSLVIHTQSSNHRRLLLCPIRAHSTNMENHLDTKSTSPRPASMQASSSGITDEDSVSFPSLSSGRWRVVSAWTSLRRFRDSPRSSRASSPTTSSTFASAYEAPSEHGSAPTSDAKSTFASTRGASTRAPSSELPAPLTRRKRVSLFLKRRRSAQPFFHGDVSEIRDAHDTRLVVSSAAAPNQSGETRRELDDAFLRRLKRRVRSAVVDANSNNHVTRADTGVSNVGTSIKHHTSNRDESEGTGIQTDVRSSRDDSCDRLAALRLAADAADSSMGRSNRSSVGVGSNEGSGDAVSVTLLRGADLKQSDGNGDSADDEIVGAICLEDFADDEPDGDYAFLDGLGIEMGTDQDTQNDDPSLLNGSLGQEGSRKEVMLDAGAVRWIADDHEFAKFFAQVGVHLDDLFDADEEQQLSEFSVGDRVINEWRAAGEEHNQRCLKWSLSNLHIEDNKAKFSSKTSATGESTSLMDIRQLAADFCPRVGAETKEKILENR